MSRLLFGSSWNTWIVPPQSPEPDQLVHLIEKSHITVLLVSLDKHCIYLFKNCIDVELCTAKEGPVNVLFGIFILLYCVRELSAQLQEQREGQGTANKQWLAAVPCPPSAPEVDPRDHLNDQIINRNS
jgi:hypothetical protein